MAAASIAKIDGKSVGLAQAIANMIQKHTGAENHSIHMSVKYPGNIDRLKDYAVKEQRDKVRPDLSGIIDNFPDYDFVYVGYPDWWYDLSMVMYSFFDACDFGGSLSFLFAPIMEADFPEPYRQSGNMNQVQE